MENIQNIRSGIESHRNAGTIVSAPDLFSQIGWGDFWPAHYGNTPLDLTFLDIVEDGDTLLTYSASTDFLRVPVLNARVTFQNSAAGVDIKIELPLPSGWHFSESFPNLPPSLDLTSIPFECKTSYLDHLIISNPTFTLSTAKLNGDDEGLSFTGDLKLQGPYGIITRLADEQALHLHGNILLDGDDANLSLKAEVKLNNDFVFAGADVQVTNVSINLYSLLEVRNFDANHTQIPTYQEWFDVCALLHFDSDKYRVDLRAMLVVGNADFIFMQGIFEEGHKLNIPSLDHLAAIVGAKDLEQLLPQQLQGDSGLAVSEFDFNFTTTGYSVSYVALTVELNKTITILDKDNVKIVLKNIEAHFQVAFPFDTANRDVSFYLTGEFDFDDGQGRPVAQIDVKASGNLIFYCGLKPGSKVDISQVFGYFGEAGLLKSMDIKSALVEKFDITVDFKNKNYGFFLDVDGLWIIRAGSLSIDVTDINLEIIKSGSLDFNGGGKFVLGGAKFTIGIARADNNWTFSGIAQPADNTTIQLGNFINELIGKSLPVEVSDQLSTLKLDYMQCNLGTAELYFEIEIDFDLGFGKEQIKFHAQRSIVDKDTTNYEIYFEYDIDSDLYFDLKLDWGQETVLSGEIKTRSGKAVALDIDAVLKKIGTSLGVINIPKVNAIDLESASFNLNLTKKSFTLLGKFSGLNVLLVAEKNDTWGFALAVDYSTTTEFADVTNVSLPGFVKIRDLYAAFSTLDRSLPFDTANEKRPSLKLKSHAFNLGCHLALNGDASSFIETHFGKKIDLWINGAIVYSPSFSLDLAVEFDAGPRTLAFTGDKRKHPSVSFNQLDAFLTVTGQNVVVGLACRISAAINEKNIQMVGKLALEENQFEISGTLEGDPVDFDLFGYKVQLGNMAIEIGDGYELVDPVIGFTGEITVPGINGFLAVLADTAEPQNCMFAASCSTIKGSSLANLVKQLCFHGDAASFKSLDALNEIAIQGTDIKKDISCTVDIVQELNDGKLPKEIAEQLKISHPVVTGGGKDASSWFVLDNNTARIYEVQKKKDKLDIRNELQLYIVPGAMVSIGDLHFPQGFRLNGCLKVFDFEADADIDVSTDGISLKGSINKAIDLGFLVISNANSPGKGPTMSLSTLSKNPHFTLSSRLQVAKILDDSADISFSEQNFHIDLQSCFFTFHARFEATGEYSRLLNADFSFLIDIHTDELAAVAANISGSIKDAANAAGTAFKKLEAAVEAARKKVDSIQDSITSIDNTIGDKNKEIARLRNEQGSISDWDYVWGKGEVLWLAYASQITAIGVEIGGLYTGKGTLMATKKIADDILSTAENALKRGDALTEEALGAIATAIAEVGKAADWFLHIRRVSINVAIAKMNATAFDTVFDVTFLGKDYSYTLHVDFKLKDVVANIEKGLHDLLYADLTKTPPQRMVRMAVVEGLPGEADQTKNISQPEALSDHIDLLNELIARQKANLGADHINNNIGLKELQASMVSAKAAYERRDQLQASYQDMDISMINKVVDNKEPIRLQVAAVTAGATEDIDDCIKLVSQADTAKVYKGEIDKKADPNTSDADKLARLNNAQDMLSLLAEKAQGFDSKELKRLQKLIDDKKGKKT